MPPYAGRIPEEDLSGILDYLIGLNAETQNVETVEKESEQPDKTAEVAIPVDLAALGEALAGKNGCLGCHSTDGSRRVGPSFKGLSGNERTVVRDGQEIRVLADFDYLRRAIKTPATEIVQGYPAAMPPYPGLSDDDIKALQAWLETLR